VVIKPIYCIPCTNFFAPQLIVKSIGSYIRALCKGGGLYRTHVNENEINLLTSSADLH